MSATVIALSPRRFCVNCVHHVAGTPGSYPGEYAKCGYLAPSKLNLVTGTPWQQPHIYCEILRNSADERCCGPDARYFEPTAVQP